MKTTNKDETDTLGDIAVILGVVAIIVMITAIVITL